MGYSFKEEKNEGQISYLPLHVHDDHCVTAVTHDELFSVLRERNDAVDCDVRPGATTEGFECVYAFCCLDVPHLNMDKSKGRFS